MAEGYGTGFLVVTNDAAGGSDDEVVERVLATLERDSDVRHEACSDPHEWEGLLAGRDGRTVVVVGGDGSLHTAVAAAWRSGELGSVPFGLVPLGTGNDFARTLGIPLDPERAASALLTGRPRTLDLLVDDDGGVVVNVVHAGLGAEAAARATPLKPGLGKAAYAVGSVVAGTTATGWALEVSVDGAAVEVDGDVLMVAVANGRTIGGGSEVAPDAAPDDGLLDVVIATSTGPLARLGFGIAMRDGEHVTRDDVVALRGRTVRVSGEPFPVNADGELETDVRSRAWTVEPGVWTLLTSSA